mgnify:CR=1 FL=1
MTTETKHLVSLAGPGVGHKAPAGEERRRPDVQR